MQGDSPLMMTCPCCKGRAVRTGQKKGVTGYLTVFKCRECEREGTAPELRAMAGRIDRSLPRGDRD